MLMEFPCGSSETILHHVLFHADLTRAPGVVQLPLMRQAGQTVLSAGLLDAQRLHQAEPSLLCCPDTHPPSAPMHQTDLGHISQQ